jgi:DnaJ-class molecular chaperone
MSKPLVSSKNLFSSNRQQVCKNCGGVGYVIIKNAYDPNYSSLEPCTSCLSTGSNLKTKSEFGPN